MIDDKKIEEAKKSFIADKKILGVMAMNDLACGFKEGANWAINEFLKNLWHSASEKPVPVIGCNNGVLVEQNEIRKPITLWKREYLYENISKYGNRFISRWLYIDDLFPTEGR